MFLNSLPPNATPGQRWRFRRNLCIYLLHKRQGLSQRFLADVFDLPSSRIAAIVKEFPSKIGVKKPCEMP